MERNEEYIKQQRKLKEENLTWSEEEKIYKYREKWRKPLLKNNTINMSLVMNVRLRNSRFGPFLKEFNNLAKQDKFVNDNKLAVEEWDRALEDVCDRMKREEHDNFVDSPYGILRRLVEKEAEITVDKLKKSIYTLRLSDQQVSCGNGRFI